MEFNPGRIRLRSLLHIPNVDEDQVDYKDQLDPNPTLFPNKRKLLTNDAITVKAPNQSSTQLNDNEDDPTSELMKMYQEPSKASENYDKFLSTQPNEADYKPSKKRRLLAIAAGALTGDPATAYQVANKISSQPFEDQLKDWERRRVPLQNASTVEEKDRANKINSLKDVINAKHQRLMDESLITSRDDQTTHRLALERQALANADALERDRIKRNSDRDTDNARQAERDKATERDRIQTHAENKQRIDISSRNASNAENRTSIYQRMQEGLAAYRKTLQDRLGTLKGDSPLAQKYAKELALHNVLDKPGNSQKYGNFYNTDEKGRITATKQPDKSFFDLNDEGFNSEMSTYSQFQKEIDDETKRVLKANHPTGSTKVDPEKDKKPVTVVSRKKL